jgi:hypothetical protein
MEITCTQTCAGTGNIWGIPKVSSRCDTGGYLEGLTVYGTTCSNGMAAIRSLPKLPQQGLSWTSNGWRWWTYPDNAGGRLIGISGAKYLDAGL